MPTSIDLLLTNAIVLTMDKNFSKYENGAVAIKDDSIVAVGDSEELETEYQAKEIIDCNGKVLMPGLVDAHTHVPMNLLRGLADDLRLDVWLLGYMMPVEREFVDPDFVRLGTALACAELIRSGVTSFADMYYYEDQVAQATAEAGLRAVVGQSVLKFPSPDAATYEEALSAAEDLIKKWKGHPLITPAVAPHAHYTSTEDILAAAVELAIKYDVPLHTHVAETTQEVEDTVHEHGMPVVPYIKKHGLLKTKLIAAHCVHIDEGEIDTLQEYGAGAAHNPTSNLKLASGIAPVPTMLENNLNVGIGTDGVCSNNDLDMFEEIRLTALLGKGSTGDPTVIPAKTAIAMATRIGAKAIHLGDITGSLEPGKRADLILVNLAALHNSPRFYNAADGIYTQLVYAAKSTDVTDVMVNGKWLMRAQELLTIKEKELLPQAQAYAKRIDDFLFKREESVFSKLIAIGGAVEQESYEVQVKVRIPSSEPIIQTIQEKLEILYQRHYHEFDTYFEFKNTNEGWLRYREDEYLDEEGKISKVRYRLTLIGPPREEHFPSDVLLSRSRFLAPAIHSLRFYREYFKPSGETFIEKNRLRWRILFQDTAFYINLDQLKQPDLGAFLEVKSRTWSLEDAEHKAQMAGDLLEYLGISPEEGKTQDYVKVIETEQA
ncbi:MAG: amidohydrolase [Anaerolineaceae bacterium 4572_5.1]|nr:MAG: amidohydrolase [Anaerolineaceae bacterium 4572_5.1]RLD10923.1 MAG: amidohydrolase [Chloroflexota bacterium]